MAEETKSGAGYTSSTMPSGVYSITTTSGQTITNANMSSSSQAASTQALTNLLISEGKVAPATIQRLNAESEMKKRGVDIEKLSQQKEEFKKQIEASDKARSQREADSKRALSVFQQGDYYSQKGANIRGEIGVQHYTGPRPAEEVRAEAEKTISANYPYVPYGSPQYNDLVGKVLAQENLTAAVFLPTTSASAPSLQSAKPPTENPMSAMSKAISGSAVSAPDYKGMPIFEMKLPSLGKGGTMSDKEFFSQKIPESVAKTLVAGYVSPEEKAAQERRASFKAIETTGFTGGIRQFLKEKREANPSQDIATSFGRGAVESIFLLPETALKLQAGGKESMQRFINNPIKETERAAVIVAAVPATIFASAVANPAEFAGGVGASLVLTAGASKVAGAVGGALTKTLPPSPTFALSVAKPIAKMPIEGGERVFGRSASILSSEGLTTEGRSSFIATILKEPATGPLGPKQAFINQETSLRQFIYGEAKTGRPIIARDSSAISPTLMIGEGPIQANIHTLTKSQGKNYFTTATAREEFATAQESIWSISGKTASKGMQTRDFSGFSKITDFEPTGIPQPYFRAAATKTGIGQSSYIPPTTLEGFSPLDIPIFPKSPRPLLGEMQKLFRAEAAAKDFQKNPNLEVLSSASKGEVQMMLEKKAAEEANMKAAIQSLENPFALKGAGRRQPIPVSPIVQQKHAAALRDFAKASEEAAAQMFSVAGGTSAAGLSGGGILLGYQLGGKGEGQLNPFITKGRERDNRVIIGGEDTGTRGIVGPVSPVANKEIPLAREAQHQRQPPIESPFETGGTTQLFREAGGQKITPLSALKPFEATAQTQKGAFAFALPNIPNFSFGGGGAFPIILPTPSLGGGGSLWGIAPRSKSIRKAKYSPSLVGLFMPRSRRSYKALQANIWSGAEVRPIPADWGFKSSRRRSPRRRYTSIRMPRYSWIFGRKPRRRR